MAQTKRVLVVAMFAGQRQHSHYVSRQRADIMLARGQARSADNGTNTIVLCSVKPRGELREWCTITNRTKNGAALFVTMQLVTPRERRAR